MKKTTITNLIDILYTDAEIVKNNAIRHKMQTIIRNTDTSYFDMHMFTNDHKRNPVNQVYSHVLRVFTKESGLNDIATNGTVAVIKKVDTSFTEEDLDFPYLLVKVMDKNGNEVTEYEDPGNEMFPIDYILSVDDSISTSVIWLNWDFPKLTENGNVKLTLHVKGEDKNIFINRNTYEKVLYFCTHIGEFVSHYCECGHTNVKDILKIKISRQDITMVFCASEKDQDCL